MTMLFPATSENAIFASEGRRDFWVGSKCSQWPYLYMTYEAIYTLKCLLFEKFAKNWFFASCGVKISFSRFSQEISILECMLLHNSYMNMAITHILHYQKSLFEHKGLRNINSDSWKTPNLAWPTFATQVPTLEPASQNHFTVNFLHNSACYLS